MATSVITMATPAAAAGSKVIVPAATAVGDVDVDTWRPGARPAPATAWRPAGGGARLATASGWFSLKGLNHPNEDRLAVTTAAGAELALIVDGHDGSRCADHVTHTLPLALSAPTADGLRAAVLATERGWVEFVAKQLRRPTATVQGLGSGACLTAAALSPDGRLAVGNLGDARALLRSADGRLRVLTEDHRVCNEAERRRIERAGGWIRNGRVVGVLEPTRTIGDLEEKARAPGAVSPEPFTLATAVAPGDVSSLAEVEAAAAAAFADADKRGPSAEPLAGAWLMRGMPVLAGGAGGGSLLGTRPCAGGPAAPHRRPVTTSATMRPAAFGGGAHLATPYAAAAGGVPAAAPLRIKTPGAPGAGTVVPLTPPPAAVPAGLPAVSIAEAAAAAPALTPSFLLLATDGVWDVLSSASAAAVVAYSLSRYRDPRVAAAELCRVARRCGSGDDISAVVVWLLRDDASGVSSTGASAANLAAADGDPEAGTVPPGGVDDEDSSATAAAAAAKRSAADATAAAAARQQHHYPPHDGGTRPAGGDGSCGGGN